VNCNFHHILDRGTSVDLYVYVNVGSETFYSLVLLFVIMSYLSNYIVAKVNLVQEGKSLRVLRSVDRGFANWGFCIIVPLR
jgi:hypothetical protein